MVSLLCVLQEIDELLGQNLSEEDEDAIAEELESIIMVRNSFQRTLERKEEVKLTVWQCGPVYP